MENEKFNVVDENGRESEAEVLTAFSYNEKDYIIFSIDKENETSDIFVSRLVKDNEGNDKIEDIEDEIERAEINKVVEEILSAAAEIE